MATNVLDIFYHPLKDANVRAALKKAIRDNDDEIMDLNRQQLDRGLDAQGNSLGRYKSFSYKGRWQPVDLKLTGEFRNKFSIEIDDKGSEIFSQDSKEAKLKARYGDIFGVPAPLISNMQEIIREDFIKYFKNELRQSYYTDD